MTEILTVEERTIYALSMPKKVAIRLKGVETTIIVEADTVDDEGVQLLVRLGNTLVGKFRRDDVQGWWICDQE